MAVPPSSDVTGTTGTAGTAGITGTSGIAGVDANLEPSVFGQRRWAEAYDPSRPRLAPAQIDLLCQYARTERPALVVDQGYGTGLSTIAWAERAASVVGIGPASAMLAAAWQRQRALALSLDMVDRVAARLRATP